MKIYVYVQEIMHLTDQKWKQYETNISLCKLFFPRIYIVVYIVQQHTYNNNIVCNAYKRMKRSHKCSEKYYMTNIIILKWRRHCRISYAQIISFLFLFFRTNERREGMK